MMLFTTNDCQVLCDGRKLATAATKEIAVKLAGTLNDAKRQNDTRHYTHSAKLNFAADNMAGVTWENEDHYATAE
jgi:hypothetical protein